MAGNLFNIPHVVSAKSVKALRRAMFDLNVSMRKEYHYFDISQGEDGKWYAWYYEDIENSEEIVKK
jgi:hypothetical protein